MPLAEIHHEAGQVRGIKELKVVRLGFIAVNGFEEREEGYRFFDGEDLYR